MNIIKRISGLFSIMEDEVKSFRLLFLQSLLIGFANSYYYIVGSSLLIKNVNIKMLPCAYIITGAGGYILIQAYKNIQKKRGITGSYKLSIITFSLICLANFIAIYFLGSNKSLSVFFAYFTMLFATPFTTIFSLGVFAQCSRLYNIAQSKRLLALIVSGEIVASVVAYLSVPFLRGLIQGNTYMLLPVSGIIILFVFSPFNKLSALYSDRLNIPAAAKKAQKIDLSFFTKDRFYLLIGVTTIFSVFAIYVVDYAYLISVRYMSNQTGIEVAEIVSVFFFIVKIGELTFSFLSGNILSNKGIKFSILLLPVILLAAASLAFVSGLLFYGLPIFLLAFLFVAKLTERAIRKSITTPSVKVLYQVAEPHERQEIEANIDGLLNQLATILAGVLLIVISIIFFGNDMFSLLHLFSFVCIIAFALWTFFSVRMYDSYRVKIKDFLSRLKAQNAGHHAIHSHSAAQLIAGASDDTTLIDDINNAIKSVRNASKADLLDLIKLYNTRQSLDANDSPEKIARKLINVYYSNHFYFSRLLIVRYMQYCGKEQTVNFFEELWEVSDIVGKLELIITFNEQTHANINISFFERLCEDCAKEITWTEACLYDTATLKDERLEEELNDHRDTLVYLLFELLKVIYEPSVMQVVYDIISTDNAELENQFFALELLDITLRPGLKEIVKHLLEPISFDDKKAVLGKTFHIYHLPAKDRLADIMMKNYNMVDPHLKETALVAYSQIAEDTNVLSAFRSSSVDNLKFKADEIALGVVEPTYEAKLNAMASIEHNYVVVAPYTSYLLNYALVNPTNAKTQSNKHVVKNNLPVGYTLELKSEGYPSIKIDALGLAILATLKQNTI